MTDRCTGHCCQRFHLGETLQTLRAERDRALCWMFGAPQGNRPRWEPIEIIKIAEMLIETDEPFRFNCRHFVSTGAPAAHGKTIGNCGNYTNRPNMCRDYPYKGDRCAFAGCTWEEARNPLVEIRRPLWKLREDEAAPLEAA